MPHLRNSFKYGRSATCGMLKVRQLEVEKGDEVVEEEVPIVCKQLQQMHMRNNQQQKEAH